MIARLRNQFYKPAADIFTRVNIASCIHYCGFKYGGVHYNPYETYISELNKRESSIRAIRQKFLDFLVSYQPRHFGEALSLDLSREYPLWHYPWNYYEPGSFYEKNWLADPDDIVDILTQNCEKGILSYKIDREFYWLERALHTMKDFGYDPENHSYIEVSMFENTKGESSYLVLDGNHRLSALHALGHSQVDVRIRANAIIKELEIPSWPCVKNGLYSEEDAHKVFVVYFNGNDNYFISSRKAKIITFGDNYETYDT